MGNVIVRKFVVTYRQPIFEDTPHPINKHVTYRKRVGYLIMEGEVELSVDLEEVSKTMGPRACTNKSRSCRDGHILVKSTSSPKVIGEDRSEETEDKRNDA